MMLERADALLAWLKSHLALWAPLALFLVIVLSVASIELTSLTPFCGTCHSMHRPYDQWSKSAHANPAFGEQVGCSDCHVRDGVIGLVQDHMINGSFQLLAEYTHAHVPAKPRVVTAMHDERCLSCHRSVSARDYEVADDRLPDALSKVGLVVPHRSHYELREFTAAEAAELARLEAKAEDSRLSLDDDERLQRLRKISKSNCSQCHSREAVDENGAVTWRKDRSVHVEQPMTCVACHSKVVHNDDPAGTRPVPGKETCLACHDGTWHGKLGVVFEIGCARGKTDLERVDREDALLCMKCHPKIRELFMRRARKAGAGK